MKYLPLSQYKTGFYTNGTEYVLAERPGNPDFYKGPYIVTSKNQLYTGKFFTSDSQLLTVLPLTNKRSPLNPPDIDVNSEIISVYDSNVTDGPPYNINKYGNRSISSINTYDPDYEYVNRNIPKMYTPVITQQEIEEGQLTRYFTKKINELIYFEISKKDFNRIVSQDNSIAFDLYLAFSIVWKIKGNEEQVFKTNKSTALSIEQQPNYPGFSQYFQGNFTQFYQNPNTQENLYTTGREFQTPDGKEYIGFYHIHPTKGPMVGAIHTIRKHDLLIPISPTIQQIESTPQPTPSPQPYTPPTPTGGGNFSGRGGY